VPAMPASWSAVAGRPRRWSCWPRAIEVEGRLVEASKTPRCRVHPLDGVQARCVTSGRGERPLWDFPDVPLAGREVSAYLLAAATAGPAYTDGAARRAARAGCLPALDRRAEDGRTLLASYPRRRYPRLYRIMARRTAKHT